MLTIEAAFADTSYDMELEKIKNKIQRLYTELLVKTFKAANPNATSEQIENFFMPCFVLFSVVVKKQIGILMFLSSINC